MSDQLITTETSVRARQKGHPDASPLLTSQATLQRWLREDHIIYVSIEIAIIGSDEWEYGYKIDWLPKPHHSEKRRCGYFQEKKSFQEGIGSYTGAWRTWEEALEKGLQKALELI